MLSNDKIYQKILKAIVEHQLPPGTKLPEDKLSKVFGMSRTGIRKILQRLALERVVIIEPNKGAQVNRPSKQEAEDVLYSRILLEPILIPELLKYWNKKNSQHFRQIVNKEDKAEKDGDLAASIQLTARFHYELARLSGNSVIAEFVEQLCYRSSLIIAAFGSNKSVSCDCGHHHELIDLLDSGDDLKAQEWMKMHLIHIQSSLIMSHEDNQKINFQQLFIQEE